MTGTEIATAAAGISAQTAARGGPPAGLMVGTAGAAVALARLAVAAAAEDSTGEAAPGGRAVVLGDQWVAAAAPRSGGQAALGAQGAARACAEVMHMTFKTAQLCGVSV